MFFLPLKKKASSLLGESNVSCPVGFTTPSPQENGLRQRRIKLCVCACVCVSGSRKKLHFDPGSGELPGEVSG